MALMTRIALVAIYMIGTVVAVFSMEADGGGSWGEICLVVSVLLGIGTGDFRFAPLSLLAIPIAIPFGYPDDVAGDPVFPVWVAATYYAAVSSTLTVLAAFARQAVESRLRRRHAPRDST
ncbi:MAG TPA: hypothetical protein VLI94_09735 [Solirubrobacterales bacterium]|nr:hypothetical protein [Solirubrobacterales bacterium]